MNVLRKMLLVILASLLPFFLFALAIGTGAIRTAGSSSNIKRILANSGIYSSVITSVLDQAKTTGGEQGGGTPLTDPTIKAVAEKTFTAQFLQENTEKVLDSIFLWLDGKTVVPDFKIDLSSLKTTFADNAAQAAQARAGTLPVCPAGLSGSADNLDPFSATCLPRGLTPASVAAEVKNNIVSGQGFLENPVITADTLKASGTNQSVFTGQLKNLPRNYQRAKKTPVILAVLALLTTLGIVFVSASRRAGLRRAGIIFMGVGIFMLIFAWGLNQAVAKELPKLKLDNVILQEKLKIMARDITREIDKTYWAIGATYAVAGTAAIAGTMFLRKDSRPKIGKDNDAPPEPPATGNPAATGPPIKKPTKKKVLIQ